MLIGLSYQKPQSAPLTITIMKTNTITATIMQTPNKHNHQSRHQRGSTSGKKGFHPLSFIGCTNLTAHFKSHICPKWHCILASHNTPVPQEVNESPETLRYIWYPELEIYGLETFGRQSVLKEMSGVRIMKNKTINYELG